jgi:hypothetical protein
MVSRRGQRFLEHLEHQRRTLRDEVEEDVAPLRALSLDERGAVVESVCRDAMAVLRARPDFPEALAAREPGSDEALRRYHAVVERFRRHGRH